MPRKLYYGFSFRSSSTFSTGLCVLFKTRSLHLTLCRLRHLPRLYICSLRNLGYYYNTMQLHTSNDLLTDSPYLHSGLYIRITHILHSVPHKETQQSLRLSSHYQHFLTLVHLQPFHALEFESIGSQKGIKYCNK